MIERSTSAVPVQDTRGDLGGGTTQGVLRVKTDDGIEGHCMIGQQAEDATAAMRQLINVIKPRMLGREVTDREWLWSQVSDISGHGLPLESVVAPLDVALWDVAGKSVGLPIYKMLGVCSTEVPLYVTYPPRFSCPEDFVEEARVAQSEGF
ncbi:MAG: hypothetical protein OSA95_14225, partial [Opitutales bacterium]|nr:hypothetical protein [Opitutales bacterium]